MFRYIVRRFLYMIPVVLGISIIAFITMYAAGDPISLIKSGKAKHQSSYTFNGLKAYYGLDKPIPIQYLTWLIEHLAVEFRKITLWWRICKFLNWTRDLAHH